MRDRRNGRGSIEASRGRNGGPSGRFLAKLVPLMEDFQQISLRDVRVCVKRETE